MKDNASTKYLLGFALLMVWGLLAMRIYQKYGNSKDHLFIQAPPKGPRSQVSTDTFAILVNYRDPFLGKPLRSNARTISSAPKLLNKRPPTRLSRKVKQKPERKPPRIEYKGTVKSKSGTEAALVSIENQFMNWKKGERYEDLKLQRIYPDSIWVTWEGRRQTIRKVRE